MTDLHTTGWYEFIVPGGSTTHIAHVYEDGSIFLPEGMDVVDETDFRLAAGTDRFWRLVREVDVRREIDAGEVAEVIRENQRLRNEIAHLEREAGLH